jgi:hypothetical protein
VNQRGGLTGHRTPFVLARMQQCNLHVHEKVPQVLQQHFVRVESGVYALT